MYAEGNNKGSNPHRATLVPQLAVTEQGLTVIYERVSLLIIQILQFVYIVLALRLPFSHVDIWQNPLDNSDLGNQGKTH